MKWFIYHCMQNVNHQSHQMAPAPGSRPKKDTAAAHFVPPLEAEDEVLYQHNMELLQGELLKRKPCTTVLKDLMQRTLSNHFKAFFSCSHTSCPLRKVYWHLFVQKYFESVKGKVLVKHTHQQTKDWAVQ